jgi:hypothetical protein
LVFVETRFTGTSRFDSVSRIPVFQSYGASTYCGSFSSSDASEPPRVVSRARKSAVSSVTSRSAGRVPRSAAAFASAASRCFACAAAFFC